MINYKVKNKKFDAIICLNGEIPDAEVFRNFKNIPIIAADGAFDRLYLMKITPKVIVGDMDSIAMLPSEEKLEIVKNEDQESNDFEKCILYLQDTDYQDILVLGFNGGLLEHTLNNTSIVVKYSNKFNFTIYHNGRYGMYIDHSAQFNVKANEIISIIPKPRVRVVTENLLWELKDEVLELGKREGARNKSISNKIRIELKEGSYFIFFDSRLPNAPVGE